MRKALLPEDKLDILRAFDRERKWYSLDDKRVCAVCDRLFSGRQIDIVAERRGGYALHCPTQDCPSNIRHWFFCHQLPVHGEVAAPWVSGSRLRLA